MMLEQLHINNVDVTMPQYFDGQIQIISTAMSMERLEIPRKRLDTQDLLMQKKRSLILNLWQMI